MLHRHRVGVHVEDDESVGASVESGVDVRPAVVDLVEHHVVGIERSEPLGEVIGDRSLAKGPGRLGDRAPVERIHARDPHQFGDAFGQSLGSHVHDAVSRRHRRHVDTRDPRAVDSCHADVRVPVPDL